MKKVYLLGAISGLLLASCANDDLVVKPTPAGENNDAIAFKMKLDNQSRATEGLENVMNNFGVWAFKAQAGADLADLSSVTDFKTSDKTVMPDYRVNYENTLSYGSNWNYVSAEWADNTAGLTQWLKYWDGSYAKTYFFAYGPHYSTRGTTEDVTLAFDATDTKATLTFPALVASGEAASNYVYADAKEEINANHIDATTQTTLAPLPVNLTFHRIPTQVRIAVWEDIPGYSVKMTTVDLVANATSGTAAVSGCGIAAIPAKYTAPDTWARGSYLNGGTPTVVYSTTTDAFDTPALSFTDATMGNDNLYFGLPTIDLDADGYIGDTYNGRSKSETVYNVMPTGKTAQPANVAMASGQTWAANDGLQFVMNYQLKSQDTEEVINVKGARCFVTPEYTAWAPNTIYTYVFKITKNSSGTTTDTNPTNDPEHPTDALYPIIFQGVVIEQATTSETEWLVNGVEFSTSSMVVKPNAADVTFGYTFDGTALTWTATPAGVINAPTQALTPYTDATSGITYPGTCTFSAGANPGIATITATNVNGASASINVIVTNGLDILTTGPVALTVGDPASQIDFVADGSVNWSSSADTVATVDAFGKVTAVGAGSAIITATCGTNTATITVNVTAAP